MDDWQEMKDCPDGKWFQGFTNAALGPTVYPCIYDSERNQYGACVDFTIVWGVYPEKWKPLSRLPGSL